jgi:hypothetical protein
MNTCEQQKTHKEQHKCTCTPTHHCSWNLMKPTTSALVSLSHTHTHLSLSLSLSLPPPSSPPSSLSQLKNLPGILRNPKIRGECKAGRVCIWLITFSSRSYTSFQDRRIARYLSGVGGEIVVKEPPGFSGTGSCGLSVGSSSL